MLFQCKDDACRERGLLCGEEGGDEEDNEEEEGSAKQGGYIPQTLLHRL